MDVTLLLGSLSVVASVGLLWWSVSRGRGQSVTLTDDGAMSQRRRLLNESAADRAVRPALHRVGTRVRSWAPADRVRTLNQKLQQTGLGERWTIEKVLATKVLLSFGCCALMLIVFVGDPSPKTMLISIGAAVFGFYIPNGIIDNRRTTRQYAIRNGLSDTIDQLNVIVRAGLGIDAAISRLSRAGGGPLADEFTRVMQEVRFGVARNVALAAMAERVGVPELRGFVSALAQSDRLGVPVAQTLDVQAKDLRERRRQFAEEQAMKLPVKILFPMVFCILPVLFIVLLGPAAMRIFEQFK